MSESNYLTCECSICISHRFEVKDRHPEMKWATSKIQKLRELQDIMKIYNCSMEKAKLIQQGQVLQSKVEVEP